MPGYDLHIHSRYSDGTYTVPEIARRAHEVGLDVIAVVDHDVLDGSIELINLPERRVSAVAAVEVSTLEDGVQWDLLGYGVNLHDPRLNKLVHHSHAALFGMSERLLDELVSQSRIVEAEYQAFQFNPEKGGWKMLQYLLASGMAGSFGEAMMLYMQNGCGHHTASFPTTSHACDVIHAAGGVPVLAHPGDSWGDKGDVSGLRAELERMMDMGVGGLECYYPKHSPEVTRMCVQLCRERWLAITSGSDCHGGFSGAPFGTFVTQGDKLDLTGIKVYAPGERFA